MIVDWKADWGNAWLYSVFDADTGECLDKERIWHANDDEGFYHRHLLNTSGRRYVIADPLTGQQRIASERVNRRIQIRPKPCPAT